MGYDFSNGVKSVRDMIQPIQNAFITAIAWGTRFPVTMYNSYGRFYNIGWPSSIYNESKMYFDKKISDCNLVLSYIKSAKKYDSKKSRRKRYNLWRDKIVLMRDKIPYNKYDWFLIRYDILSDIIVEMLPPLSILALEDQPIFYTDSYDRIKPRDDSWLSDMRIDILFALIVAKVNELGIEVVRVSPLYTSATCPMCGNVDNNNRNKFQHKYCCSRCGTVMNDDGLAALNIYNKAYEQKFGISVPQTLYGDSRKIVLLHHQGKYIDIPHSELEKETMYPIITYSSLIDDIKRDIANL